MDVDPSAEMPPGTMTIQVIDGMVFLGVPDHERPLVATVEMTPETARQVGSELFRAGCIAENKE